VKQIAGPIGLLVVLFGYLVAVFIAVVVTLALVMIGGLLTADDPLPGFAATFILGIWVGCLITFPTALPGFILSVVLARMVEMERLAWFTAAGAVDALLALGLFTLFDRTVYFPAPVVVACVIGGLAGGAAYWKAAGRFLTEWLTPEVA
jgi:hypothetical protein